jgi:capsular exopolysaccharide synthesis family protein
MPGVQPEAESGAAAEKYIDYSDIVRFLKRYWLTVALTSSVAIAAAGLYLLQAQPIFTARAQVLIDPHMPGMMRERIGETIISLDSSQLESQMAVLRSEELAETVIKSLNLLDNPEFQPKEPSAVKQALQSMWARLRLATYQSGAAAYAPGMGSPAETVAGPTENDDLLMRIALAIFLSKLDVRRVGISYAIDVSFTSVNPATAARIANAIADAYVADQIATQADAARQGSDWLKERIQQIRQQMNAASLKVQEFKARRDYRIVGKRDSASEPDAPTLPLGDAEQARSDVNTLEALESTAQTYRKIYEKFLEAFAEAVQRQSFPVANARIITKATEPLDKSHPKAALVLALGLLVGAMAGCGIALVRNSVDGSVRSSRQIRELLGIECLGQVPQLNPKDRGRGFAAVSDAPFSRFSDGLTRVKTAISLARKAQPIRSLGVISARPGEGKSTITSNLAELFSSSGMRTLLVDADVRHSTLSQSLAPQATVGLVEVLNGTAEAGQCIVQLNDVLNILPAASKKPVRNSSNLLSSEKMRLLLRDLGQTYDIVIVDLPPLNALADGLAMSSLLDSIVLLAEWGETPLRLLEETVYTLRAAQAKVLGVVITKVSTKAHDVNGNRAHSYYY